MRLTIQDDGPGMSPEEIRKALGGGYTTKANGTGLGLSICKHILGSHGGGISITSTPGQGTNCIIDLPAIRAP